jgi:putative membrane protein
MKPHTITISMFAAAVAAVCLSSTAPVARAADEKTKASAGKVAAADKKFMLAAAQGGMLEVRLGEIAKEKATRQEVKDFGTMMAADHGKADEELKAVAAKNGVTLPTDLDAKHKAIVDKLSKLSGAEFEQAYIAEMVKDHKKDAAAFEEASKTVKNADVKAFATEMLPVIKTHLEKIKAIAAEKK